MEKLPVPSSAPRILVVCALDLMAWVLLRPWLQGMQSAGYDVHIACSRGSYFERLASAGFHMHEVHIQRKVAPWLHIKPLREIYKLIGHNGFEIVNTHGPIAAAIGRTAAWLAGCKTIIYTVHGFYFHENMHAFMRIPVVVVEWLLGRITDHFMFVSDEDHRTAIRTRIASTRSRTTTITNGVDLAMFPAKDGGTQAASKLREQLGIGKTESVIGIVGRIVREKGYREFLDMAVSVSNNHRTKFLIIGDTLQSDRDQFGKLFRALVMQSGLADRFIFTGHTDQVADYLQILDIFTLPSYREGFPRSILEAMAVGLPVVATNIRGCRESVVNGQTGLLVPPGDSKALADAVEQLLLHPDTAISMGLAGRHRVVERYSHIKVQRDFVSFINAVRTVPQQ